VQQLTGKVSTNSVTYLQPVILTSDSFTGTGPSRVFLTIPATRSGNDYVLQLSDSEAFTRIVTIKPYNPSAIQFAAPSQLDPRNGPPFAFFNPNSNPLGATGGVDFTASVMPQLGNPTQVFARIGVRDSRNGSSNTTNPYLFCAPVQVPPALI